VHPGPRSTLPDRAQPIRSPITDAGISQAAGSPPSCSAALTSRSSITCSHRCPGPICDGYRASSGTSARRPGFGFLEGPIWNPREGCLYFSDITGDARIRWSERDGASIARQPNFKGNGMTYDGGLALITCEHSTSRVTRNNGDTEEVLASHFNDRELNSPNDVVVSRAGVIYFTDPTFGRTSADFGLLRDPQLDFRGVFRITTDGDLELIDGDYNEPNGLCFSPDEQVLYVNDCRSHHIYQYQIGPDGSVGDRTALVEGITGFDGMKCDHHGNIYITGPEGTGILVFDQTGRRLGTLTVPEKPANLNWGGPTWSDLYICARTSLYRYALKVPGARCSYMDG
jgi:gluconolactonase